MTNKIDQLAYSKLLIEVAPKVIETDEEYFRFLDIAERLFFNKNKTIEERTMFLLLRELISKYELELYPIEKSDPHEMLRYCMESSSTRQKDLVGIIGSSGVVSETVNGKRRISKNQAKALGKYFKVSPLLFL